MAGVQAFQPIKSCSLTDTCPLAPHVCQNLRQAVGSLPGAPTPFATKAVAEGLEAPSEAGDELGLS